MRFSKEVKLLHLEDNPQSTLLTVVLKRECNVMCNLISRSLSTQSKGKAYWMFHSFAGFFAFLEKWRLKLESNPLGTQCQWDGTAWWPPDLRGCQGSPQLQWLPPAMSLPGASQPDSCSCIQLHFIYTWSEGTRSWSDQRFKRSLLPQIEYLEF